MGGETLRRWGSVAWTITIIVLAAIGALGIGLAIGGGGTHAHGGPTTPDTGPTTLAGTYRDAYDSLVAAENVDITKRPQTAASLFDQIQQHQIFDAAVRAMSFPDSMQSDVKQLLSTDAGLEQALGTLAANVENVYNYNGLFPTMTSANVAFRATNATVSNDLGLAAP